MTRINNYKNLQINKNKMKVSTSRSNHLIDTSNQINVVKGVFNMYYSRVNNNLYYYISNSIS